MKTTVELPNRLLLRAKTVAVQRGTTLKRLIIEGLEIVTRAPQASPDEALGEEEAEIMELDAHGVLVLKRLPGEARQVTNEHIDRLREELGV